MLSREHRSMSISRDPNRNLVGVGRDEPVGSNKGGKKNWKILKDKLKHRKAGSGSAWTSTLHVPASDVTLPSNKRPPNMESNNVNVPPSGVDLRSRSAMFQRTASRAVDRGSSSRFNASFVRRETEEEEEGSEGEESSHEAHGGAGDKKVSMSLMALLAETDKEMGLDGSSYIMGDDEEEEDEEEFEDEKEAYQGGGGRKSGEDQYSNCCVCMVRHKGAASTPCGHTYCRLCSKELHVQKGSCPLCNNFILEILDIF